MDDGYYDCQHGVDLTVTEGINQLKVLTRVKAVYNHLLFRFIREGRRHFRHSL